MVERGVREKRGWRGVRERGVGSVTIMRLRKRFAGLRRACGGLQIACAERARACKMLARACAGRARACRSDVQACRWGGWGRASGARGTLSENAKAKRRQRESKEERDGQPQASQWMKPLLSSAVCSGLPLFASLRSPAHFTAAVPANLPANHPDREPATRPDY